MVARISTAAQLRDKAVTIGDSLRGLSSLSCASGVRADGEREGMGRLTQDRHNGSCLCLVIKGTPEARRNYRARASDRSTPRRTMASAVASLWFPAPASAGNA